MPSFIITSSDSPNTPPKEQKWPGSRKDWLTPGEAYGLLHPIQDSVLSRAGIETLEEQHQLIGITFQGSRLYPVFQFDNRGRIRSGAHELAQAIAGYLGTQAKVEVVIRWLFSGQKVLEGARPCDRFKTEPQQVIDAASKRFAKLPSTGISKARKPRSRPRSR